MYFLIENAAFINKGAALMLRAIVHELRSRNAAYRIAIDAKTFRTSPEEARSCDLFRTDTNSRIKFYPQWYLEKSRIVKEGNIDVVLDAGGFQFSDQFESFYSAQGNRNLEQHYRYLKSKGTKLIFLPQALGPFREGKLAIERIRIVGRYADIIYARDNVSHQHLTGVLNSDAKVRQCIDFTNIFKPKAPLTNLLNKGQAICVVPNSRMITHTGKSTSGNYLEFMVALCNHLQDKGEEVILLNHEGADDEELIHAIRARLHREAKYITDLNALEVKALLGRMKIVISSRYHGVISALSQGVITFCTSWSHKYEEVMKDYDNISNILDINDVDLATSKLDQALEGSPGFVPSQEKMKGLENATKALWTDVFSFINAK